MRMVYKELPTSFLDNLEQPLWAGVYGCLEGYGSRHHTCRCLICQTPLPLPRCSGRFLEVLTLLTGPHLYLQVASLGSPHHRK